MISIIVQLILISIMFACWNGYVILWGVHKNIPFWNERRSKWSKIWHGIGWVVRFQIAVLIASIIYYQNGFDWITMLKWELLYLNIAATLYDLIINIIRYSAVGHPPIFYVDDKGINKIMMDIFGGPTGYWIARIVFLIITIGILFINFYELHI